MTAIPNLQLNWCAPADFDSSQPLLYGKSRKLKLSALNHKRSSSLGIRDVDVKRSILSPIKAMESSKATSSINGNAVSFRQSGCNSGDDVITNECDDFSGTSMPRCLKLEIRQILFGTSVLWRRVKENSCLDKRAVSFGLRASAVQWWHISGKSTLTCTLNRGLHARGKLTYILDGDNVRHGLNSDLGFKAEDRTENIRRIGEVAKLFSDAGVICIASLISPYRKDREACCALLPEGDFIEVFMDVPLQVCERRDPKGLYKLARAGKINGFTGVEDPYEPPLDSEIVLHQQGGVSDSPINLAEKVISYLERKGYLEA